jgi:cystathionine beta-synthase
MANGRLVGILDESDILAAVEGGEIGRKDRFDRLVKSYMTKGLQLVQVNDPLDSLLPIFARDRVALVCDHDIFVGIITRIDLINYLRLHV